MDPLLDPRTPLRPKEMPSGSGSGSAAYLYQQQYLQRSRPVPAAVGSPPRKGRRWADEVRDDAGAGGPAGRSGAGEGAGGEQGVRRSMERSGDRGGEQGVRRSMERLGVSDGRGGGGGAGAGGERDSVMTLRPGQTQGHQRTGSGVEAGGASAEAGQGANAGSLSDLSTYIRRTQGHAPPPLVGASTTVVGDKLYVFGGRLVPTRTMISDLYALDLHTFVWERVWPLAEPPPAPTSAGKGKGKAKAEDESFLTTTDGSLSPETPSAFGRSPTSAPTSASPQQPSPSAPPAPSFAAPGRPSTDAPLPPAAAAAAATLSPGTIAALLPEDNAFEAAQRRAGPQARYFHSAEVWGDHRIVFFGGMGYVAPPSPTSNSGPNLNSIVNAKPNPNADDTRPSSPLQPLRGNNTNTGHVPQPSVDSTRSDGPPGSAGGADQVLRVLDDVFMFDVVNRRWEFPRPRCAQGVEYPTARYAHLSSLTEQRGVLDAKGKGKATEVDDGFEEEGEGSVLERGQTFRSPDPKRRRRGGKEGTRRTGRALLALMGGQDMANQYIRELDVLDLHSMTWVERRRFAGNYGTYRSVACAGRWSVRHEDPWAPRDVEGEEGSGAGEGEDGEEKELRQFSWSERPTVDSPEPVYIYSNFNFSDVQRDLELVSFPNSPPPGASVSPADHYTTVQPLSHTMGGPSLPPGLRFPTGTIIGHHLIVSGTLLSTHNQCFSIWALNLGSGHADLALSPSESVDLPHLTWHKFEAGSILASGSWSRACAWGDRLVVLGDRTRDIGVDYHKRRLNFAHAVVVELESSAIYQPPPSTPNALNIAKVGLELLYSPLLGDLEVECLDGRILRCSREVLERRWPWFREEQMQHRQLGRDKLLELQTSGQLPPDAVLDDDGNVPDVSDPRYLPTRLHFPHSSVLSLAFLEWLYAGRILCTALHRDVPVLATLLQFAESYGEQELKRQTVHALHCALAKGGTISTPGAMNGATTKEERRRSTAASTGIGAATDVTVAALIYQAATLSDCMPLQLRCLKAFYTPSRNSRTSIGPS